MLKQEILTNLASATAGVFLMCVITLVHPLAAVLCTVSVFTVMLGLFFLIWALDMRFNSVSAINLVMAVGLSVDYSLHMSLHIVTTPGESRVE